MPATQSPIITHDETTWPGLKTRLMVGMEIHVELATRSKMWTSAPNVAHPDFEDAHPNTLLDPVVIGMPGTLPVMNESAVEMSVRVGLALNCQIADRCKWDRKSYYYPDLPKNYQISQYDQPLCGQGWLEVPVSDEADAPVHTIRIIRAHLEEDAGKLLHEAPGGAPIDYSIVDLNRAGTPLLEIVTEPDFSTAEQAVAFGVALRDICRSLGVTQGVMQRGHMRFEPNINVIIERQGQTYKTPIVEIKNLNSFKAVLGAIRYEYHRQVEHWLETGQVMQSGTKSTRGWDDDKQITFLQREKEEAHDYRYFPDPDLAPLQVDPAWVAQLREGLPELPLQRFGRYTKEMGLGVKEARAILDEPGVATFYESLLALGVDGKRAAAVLLNYGAKRANERGCRIDELPITAQQIKTIIDLTDQDKISSDGADKLFEHCCDSANQDVENPDGADPAKLAESLNLLQVSDAGALDQYIDDVLNNPKNQKAIADIKAGKQAAIGALIGQVMKASQGQANPKRVKEMIASRL